MTAATIIAGHVPIMWGHEPTRTSPNESPRTSWDGVITSVMMN
jgi:hypothetical protein